MSSNYFPPNAWGPPCPGPSDYFPINYWGPACVAQPVAVVAETPITAPGTCTRAAFDPSTDYTVWDFTECITYTSSRKSGQQVDSIPVAKRRALNTREMAGSAGAYESHDIVWIIPQALMAVGFVPKPGDVITDCDQQNWTVLEAGLGKIRQTHRLVTRNLAVAFDLADWIDIEQATLSYDAGGSPVKQFPPDGGKALYAQVQAKVQLASDVIVDERETRGFKGSHVVYVSKQLALTPNFDEHRIRWVDKGLVKYLDIVAVRNPELITDLPAIDAELRP